jgi:hypothetical protein
VGSSEGDGDGANVSVGNWETVAGGVWPFAPLSIAAMQKINEETKQEILPMVDQVV